MNSIDSNKLKDFSDFEKEALEKGSQEALESDIQRFLNKLHRKQREDIEEKISNIEERCRIEIRETLEKQVKLQLEKHFRTVVESCQGHIDQTLSSFIGQAQRAVNQLNHTVQQTNMLCHEIQEKYALRWGKPFLILMIGTTLTGAFMGLGLFMMQVPSVAVFLMNEQTRHAYELGQMRQNEWGALKEKAVHIYKKDPVKKNRSQR